MATAAINLGLVKPSPFSVPKSQSPSKLWVFTLRHRLCRLRNFLRGFGVDLDNMDDKEFPEVQDLEFLDCIF